MNSFDQTMPLIGLRPMLYAHRCRVELPGLDLGRRGRAALVLVAHYKSAELDINLRTARIGCPGMSARVSMLKIEPYFSRGADCAILQIETPDVENPLVVMFTAHYKQQELEVSIRPTRGDVERRQGDTVRVSLAGLPEFFRWCRRATEIHGGKMCGLDREDLAMLCGVQPGAMGVSFDGLDLTGIDILDADAEVDADALQAGIQ